MFPFFHHHHHSHHPFRHAGRQRGHGFGFGFGPPGGSRGHHERDFDGVGPGRKLSSADLQLLILALLAEQPRHGYELIKAIDERSAGYYVPSPGMVYPALSYLEEVGHASVQAEGAKKLYTITDDGRAELDAHRAAADAMLEQLAWIGQRMQRVRDAFGGEPDGDRAEASGWRGFGRHGRAPEVREAMHAVRDALKAALQKGATATPEELQRITRILQRAAAEIRGGAGSA